MSFLPFVLIIDWYLLIPAVAVQIFNPAVEHLMPIGIPNEEGKADIKTHPPTTEAKIRKCSM